MTLAIEVGTAADGRKTVLDRDSNSAFAPRITARRAILLSKSSVAFGESARLRRAHRNRELCGNGYARAPPIFISDPLIPTLMTRPAPIGT